MCKLESSMRYSGTFLVSCILEVMKSFIITTKRLDRDQVFAVSQSSKRNLDIVES